LPLGIAAIDRRESEDSVIRTFAFILLCLIAAFPAQAGGQSGGSWKFAVSGDSRNCGDVIMPAIAKSVVEDKAEFYWHLGDLRAMYDVDEDMQQQYKKTLKVEEYRRIAWGDFLSNQVAPFATLPVHLGIGNHELAGNKTRADFVTQFDYWLDSPELREQRLKDNPSNTEVKTYYHWKQHNVDFIYLDNAGDDGFDDAQVNWFERVLERDRTDSQVKTIVVGMHRALPNSLACGHSMNGDLGHESVNGIQSGRRAYLDLVKWNKETKKFVYVLASHSHFFMQDLYDTDYWKNPEHGGEILSGWIVGTAGARRYALPELTPEMKAKTKAETAVSGYLMATVEPNGAIGFEFVKLGPDSLPKEMHDRYDSEFIKFCFAGNTDFTPHPPPESCKER
jgi:hypothetical protein